MSPSTSTPRLCIVRYAVLALAAVICGPQHSTAATLEWTGADSALWSVPGNWSGGQVPTSLDEAFFGFTAPVTGSVITLGAGSLAERLWLSGDYTFSGGDLSLASGIVRVTRGHRLVIDSLLSGSGGFSLSGGGAVRLNAAGNSYTGPTSVSNGTLVISHPGALGLSTTPVVISGSATRGFGGGSLVLDAVQAPLTFARDLVLQGLGPITDRNAALIGVGDTTITGTVQYGASNVATAVNSVAGLMRLEGSLFAQGTGNLRFGTVNSVGVGGYQLNGWLYGSTGSIEKIGGGTLILDPANSAAFSGTVLVNGGSVRVAHGSALGLSVANGAITLGAGVGTFEVRSDAPNSFATRRVLMGTSGNAVLHLDHAVDSQLLNQNVTFGPLTLQAGGTTRTLTINGRNGYGATFAGDSIGGALGGNNTITVNANGPITIGGNFWNNTSTTARTLTMTVNAGSRFIVEGSLIASGAAHLLTKTGAGTLAILGNDSTYTGVTNINGGTLEVSSFGSLNNNTAAVNIGTSGTAGVLNIVGSDLTPGQATTNKIFNLAGTTGGATLLANQTGSSPGLIFNAGLAVTGAGAKTLTLGGSNTLDNRIVGGIVDNVGVTSLVKNGSGTWVLAGTNSYTGTTTIANGVLKIEANAPASTTLPTGANVTFNASGVFAGGTFDFVGRPDEANVQNLGILSYSAGANTLRVTPGTDGSASINITRLNTTGAATLNIVGADFLNNRVSITNINDSAGSNGIITRSVYWNGADFAYREGGVLRAPVYGTDAGTVITGAALTSGQHNLLTDSLSNASVSVSTLKIAGSHTLTLNEGATLTLSTGGLLTDGGSAVITGGTVALGTQAFVVRVNGTDDFLTLASASTGSGG